MRGPSIAPNVQKDIAQMYDSGINVAEIKSTYEISDSVLYGILKRQDVPTRRLRAASVGTDRAAHELAELPVTLPMRVQTDSNGLVESVTPVRSSVKTYTWEVRFESAMRVEAASIEAAISEVSRLPMCRRVFHVALKGSPS
jgi:hypothetical protein